MTAPDDDKLRSKISKIAGIVSAVVAVLVAVTVYAATSRYDQTWASIASVVAGAIAATAVWWHIE